MLELCLVGKVASKTAHSSGSFKRIFYDPHLRLSLKTGKRENCILSVLTVLWFLFSFYTTEKQESTVRVLDTLQVTAVL